MTERKKILLDVLNETINIIEKASDILERSYNKCLAIGIKKEYSFEEMESFDAFTSRFARASDIYSQKLFRTLFELLDEYPESVLDLLNSAEKHNIITSVDHISEIRKLQNDIAHEYWANNIKLKFQDVLEHTPSLLSSMKLTLAYCKKRGWINK